MFPVHTNTSSHTPALIPNSTRLLTAPIPPSPFPHKYIVWPTTEVSSGNLQQYHVNAGHQAGKRYKYCSCSRATSPNCINQSNHRILFIIASHCGYSATTGLFKDAIEAVHIPSTHTWYWITGMGCIWN